jgi:hypothetical protein
MVVHLLLGDLWKDRNKIELITWLKEIAVLPIFYHSTLKIVYIYINLNLIV